jgi:hypothetical protein
VQPVQAPLAHPFSQTAAISSGCEQESNHHTLPSWQSVETCGVQAQVSPSHSRPAVQAPQLPPHPSSPHSLPVQSGRQETHSPPPSGS